MARPLATSTVQWIYSKPSCWSNLDRHPHCMRLCPLQWACLPTLSKGKAILRFDGSCAPFLLASSWLGGAIRCADQAHLWSRRAVPNVQDLMPDDLSGADVMIIKTKCTINVMYLNRPETTMTPTPSVEKLSSTKLVPGAKMVGHWWSRRSLYLDPHRASGSSGSLGNMPGSKRDTPENFSGSCETPPGLRFAHSCMYHFYRRFLSQLHQVSWDICLDPCDNWNLWS